MRQQTFELSEPLFDFDAVEGGEVVEGEREEGFHRFEGGRRVMLGSWGVIFVWEDCVGSWDSGEIFFFFFRLRVDVNKFLVGRAFGWNNCLIPNLIQLSLILGLLYQ